MRGRCRIWIAGTWVRWSCVGLGMLIGGCTSADGSVAAGWVFDVARAAMAAWLL